MTDIVERLLGASRVAYSEDMRLFMRPEDCKAAAEELLRLRKIVNSRPQLRLVNTAEPLSISPPETP